MVGMSTKITIRTFLRRVSQAFADLLDDRPPCVVPLNFVSTNQKGEVAEIGPGDTFIATSRPQRRDFQITRIEILDEHLWEVLDITIGNRSQVASSRGRIIGPLRDIRFEVCGAAMDVVIAGRRRAVVGATAFPSPFYATAYGEDAKT